MKQHSATTTMLFSLILHHNHLYPQQRVALAFTRTFEKPAWNIPASRLFSSFLFDDDADALEENHGGKGLTISGYKRPVVNWYQGHIAKAERMLAETLVRI